MRVQVIIYMDPVVMGYPATLQGTKQGGEAIESLRLTRLFAWPFVGSDGDNISWLLDGPTPTPCHSWRVFLCGYITIPHKLWDWVCITSCILHVEHFIKFPYALLKPVNNYTFLHWRHPN